MQELIKLSKDQSGNIAVSAKHLFIFLGFDKKHWSRWSNKNIIQNQFAVEGEDWRGYTTMANGNETTDYSLSLEFAKRIAMTAKTERGDQARTYFLECEKKSQNPIANMTRVEMARMLLESEEEKERTQAQLQLANTTIQIQAPKVQYFDSVLQSNSLITVNTIAGEVGMSNISLNKKLKDMGIQYKQSDRWHLSPKYRGNEYTKDKTHHYYDEHGMPQTKEHMYWTQKGRLFILDILSKQKQTA